MNTKRWLSAIMGMGSIFFLSGCYTQVATNPDRQEEYSYRQEQTYDESDTTAATAAAAQEEYTENDNRPYRNQLGFQYYYPSWSSQVYYDEPWWPSVSFGYYYNGWICGTPYAYYPWHHRYYSYYPYPGYGWDYYYSPYNNYSKYVYEPAYTTRTGGVRRGGAAGMRDDGGSRGGSSAPSGMTLPTAGRIAGSGSEGVSRSTTSSRRGLDAIFGRSAESRTATGRSSSSSGRDAATSARGEAASSTRDNSGTSRIVFPSRSNSGRRSIFIFPQDGGSNSGKSSSNEGNRSSAPSRQESSRPSYSPPARSSSPAPSAPAPSSSGGGRSGGSSSESRGSGPRR